MGSAATPTSGPWKCPGHAKEPPDAPVSAIKPPNQVGLWADRQTDRRPEKETGGGGSRSWEAKAWRLPVR